MSVATHRTNQEVFEQTVRELHKLAGIPVVELTSSGLLETLDHGEGSRASALSLVIHAHVAKMFECFRPFQQDAWTEQLGMLEPRIIQGLDRAYKTLLRTLNWLEGGAGPSDPQLWQFLVPAWYGLEGWNKLANEPVMKFEYSLRLFADFGTSISFREGDIVETVERLSEYKSSLARFDWHRYFIGHLIDELHRESERFTFDCWANLLDLCAHLVANSELAGIEYDYGPDIGNIQFGAPISTSEFWAWQFGKAAALAIHLDEKELDDPLDDSEVFETWGTGLVALSLLDSAIMPSKWRSKRLWTGAVTSWAYERSSEDVITIEQPLWPSELTSSSHLLWLMRLGALMTTEGVPSSRIASSREKQFRASNSEMLVLGNLSTLAERVALELEKAQIKRNEDLVTEVHNLIPALWGKLPEDVQEELIEAETCIKQRKSRNASLHYANAVEAALTI